MKRKTIKAKDVKVGDRIELDRVYGGHFRGKFYLVLDVFFNAVKLFPSDKKIAFHVDSGTEKFFTVNFDQEDQVVIQRP